MLLHVNAGDKAFKSMSLWGHSYSNHNTSVPTGATSVPGTQWLPKEHLFPSVGEVIQLLDYLRVLWWLVTIELEAGPATCLRSNMALGLVRF